MDKLKPIIEQKFWIFLGLALLLPFVGWYLATSSYAKGVEERESLIEQTFGKMQFTGDVPNQVWVDGADAIVQTEQKRFEAAQKNLWISQKESMQWPAGLQSLMENVPYEGEIDATTREKYSQNYFRQLSEMEEQLRPFDYETGEGVLLFDPSSYTHVPDKTWEYQAPTSAEMWNAQIDTWLVRAVFDSIISMNKGRDKITEAPVRQLLELTLRGGERDYSGATSGSGGDASSDMMEDTAMYEDTGMTGSGGGGTAGSFQADVKFDLSEELGPAGTGYSGGSSGGGMEDMFSTSASEGYGGDAGGEYGAVAGPDRYVDDDEGYPFRTRAFVLGVIMDHRALPDFMAELSRSDWPIQIIRVQTRAINLDELPLAGRTGTSSPYSPMGTGGASPGFGTSSYGGSDAGGEGYSPGGSGAFGPGPTASSGGGYGGDSGSSYTGARPGIPGGIVPGSTPGARNAAGLVNQAMSDPYLAEVWIGGLITLFRPVENDETTAAESSQSPGATLGTESTDDATPSDPDAAAPGTTPVPADGSTAPGAPIPGADASSSPAPDETETQIPQTPPPDTESSTGTDN